MGERQVRKSKRRSDRKSKRQSKRQSNRQYKRRSERKSKRKYKRRSERKSERKSKRQSKRRSERKSNGRSGRQSKRKSKRKSKGRSKRKSKQTGGGVKTWSVSSWPPDSNGNMRVWLKGDSEPYFVGIPKGMYPGDKIDITIITEQLIVPEGAVSGDTLSFQVNGDTHNTVVPKRLAAGEKFTATILLPAPNTGMGNRFVKSLKSMLGSEEQVVQPVQAVQPGHVSLPQALPVEPPPDEPPAQADLGLEYITLEQAGELLKESFDQRAIDIFNGLAGSRQTVRAQDFIDEISKLWGSEEQAVWESEEQAAKKIQAAVRGRHAQTLSKDDVYLLLESYMRQNSNIILPEKSLQDWIASAFTAEGVQDDGNITLKQYDKLYSRAQQIIAKSDVEGDWPVVAKAAAQMGISPHELMAMTEEKFKEAKFKVDSPITHFTPEERGALSTERQTFRGAINRRGRMEAAKKRGESVAATLIQAAARGRLARAQVKPGMEPEERLTFAQVHDLVLEELEIAGLDHQVTDDFIKTLFDLQGVDEDGTIAKKAFESGSFYDLTEEEMDKLEQGEMEMTTESETDDSEYESEDEASDEAKLAEFEEPRLPGEQQQQQQQHQRPQGGSHRAQGHDGRDVRPDESDFEQFEDPQGGSHRAQGQGEQQQQQQQQQRQQHQQGQQPSQGPGPQVEAPEVSNYLKQYNLAADEILAAVYDKISNGDDPTDVRNQAVIDIGTAMDTTIAEASEVYTGYIDRDQYNQVGYDYVEFIRDDTNWTAAKVVEHVNQQSQQHHQDEGAQPRLQPDLGTQVEEGQPQHEQHEQLWQPQHDEQPHQPHQPQGLVQQQPRYQGRQAMVQAVDRAHAAYQRGPKGERPDSGRGRSMPYASGEAGSESGSESGSEISELSGSSNPTRYGDSAHDIDEQIRVALAHIVDKLPDSVEGEEARNFDLEVGAKWSDDVPDNFKRIFFTEFIDEAGIETDKPNRDLFPNEYITFLRVLLEIDDSSYNFPRRRLGDIDDMRLWIREYTHGVSIGGLKLRADNFVRMVNEGDDGGGLAALILKYRIQVDHTDTGDQAARRAEQERMGMETEEFEAQLHSLPQWWGSQAISQYDKLEELSIEELHNLATGLNIAGLDIADKSKGDIIHDIMYAQARAEKEQVKAEQEQARAAQAVPIPLGFDTIMARAALERAAVLWEQKQARAAQEQADQPDQARRAEKEAQDQARAEQARRADQKARAEQARRAEQEQVRAEQAQEQAEKEAQARAEKEQVRARRADQAQEQAEKERKAGITDVYTRSSLEEQDMKRLKTLATLKKVPQKGVGEVPWVKGPLIDAILANVAAKRPLGPAPGPPPGLGAPAKRSLGPKPGGGPGLEPQHPV